MTNISTGVSDKLLDGDNTGLLECEHHKFKDGDRSALMSALVICALHGESMPDWVEDEILQVDEALNGDEIQDLNAFFGFNKQHKSIRDKSINLANVEKKIFHALVNHRWDGKGFTVDNFDEIAIELCVGRRQVEQVYKDNRDELNKLSKNRSINESVMNGVLPSLIELARHRRKRNK